MGKNKIKKKGGDNMNFFFPPKEILNFHTFLKKILPSIAEEGYARLFLEFCSPSQTYIYASNQDIYIQYFIGYENKYLITHNFDFQNYLISIEREAINNFILKNFRRLSQFQKFLDWDEDFEVISKKRCFIYQKIEGKIKSFSRCSIKEKQEKFSFPLHLFNEFLDILQSFSFFYLEKRKDYGLSAHQANTWVKIIISSWVIERRYNHGYSNITRKAKGNCEIF
jgi:hypothetical protein